MEILGSNISTQQRRTHYSVNEVYYFANGSTYSVNKNTNSVNKSIYSVNESVLVRKYLVLFFGKSSTTFPKGFQKAESMMRA